MPFCSESETTTAEMVAVGHYLYTGEVVEGSIKFWAPTLFKVIGHGRWERETYMGLLCEKSLKKEGAYERRRKEKVG